MGLFGPRSAPLRTRIGSVTGSDGDGAGGQVWSSVFQIMVAVVYAVSAFGLIAKLRSAKWYKRFHIYSSVFAWAVLFFPAANLVNPIPGRWYQHLFNIICTSFFRSKYFLFLISQQWQSMTSRRPNTNQKTFTSLILYQWLNQDNYFSLFSASSCDR